jgi:hypothetical protein
MFGIFSLMVRVAVDGCELVWEVGLGSAYLTVSGRDGPAVTGERACVRFDVSGHHLRISLNIVPVKRAVDVSVQPSIFPRREPTIGALRDQLGRAGPEPRR